MSGLPVEVRDRAARAVYLFDKEGKFWERQWDEHRGEGWQEIWYALVDAVAEVLAEHQPKVDLEHPDPSRRMSFEQSMSSIEARFGKALDVLDRIDRLESKLAKQRKRRKAAEAKVAEMAETSNAAIAGLTNYDRRCREIAAERDALQARVGKLRAALERVGEAFADAALAADDRAVGAD